MTPGFLENLMEKSEVYEITFNKLCKQSKEDKALIDCVEQIQTWLKECIDHGRYLTDRSADRKALQALVNFWTSLLRQYGHDVFAVSRLAAFDATAGVPLDVKFPYPGLKAYDENFEEDFYGRESTVSTCISRLTENRVVLIIGDSGSGKSSLALAGVAPNLKKDHPDWLLVRAFTPGDKPFKSLSKALSESLEKLPDANTIEQKLRAHPENTKSTLAEILGSDKSIFLLIDQFEELLTQCQDTIEQTAFSTLLCQLLSPAPASLPDQSPAFDKLHIHVLLTLRADHRSRFENSTALKPLFALLSGIKESQGILQLTSIGFDSIRQAIEKPAIKVGLRFIPPTLIDALASQSASLMDGLPLLQYALKRLWELRPGVPAITDAQGNIIEPSHQLDFINQETFDELPNVQDALGKVAEQVYQSFTPQQKTLCKRLMLELVLLDENFSEPLRRRRAKCEILTICKHMQWPDIMMENIIDAFDSKGLLRLSGDNRENFEVAHEAMFRNWPTFREWIENQESKTRLHDIKQIRREALEWHNKEHSSDYLKLTGEPLISAQQYVAEFWLMDKYATAYVDACLQEEQSWLEQQKQTEQAKQQAQQAENARKLAEIKQQSTQIKNYWTLSGAMVCFIAGVGIWFWYKDIQKSNTLVSAPLISTKLLPGEALDLNYSLATKGGTPFNSLLAKTLENLEYRRLFRSTDYKAIHIEGQGTALFAYPKTETNLKIFRLCRDGGLDQTSIDIAHQQLTNFQISPPILNHEDGKTDSRLLVTINQTPNQDTQIRVSRLTWDNQPCQGDSKVPEPIPVTNTALEVPQEYKNFSPMAFSKDGNYVAFSARTDLSPNPKDDLKSRLQIFDVERGTWHDKTPQLEKLPENEHIISVVAFPKLESTRVTGRLNGALYCDGTLQTLFNESKKSERNLGDVEDKSPIVEVVSSPLPTDDGAEPWFIVRLKSGKIIPWQCGSKEKQHPFVKARTNQTIDSLSINNMPMPDNHPLPLVTYVEGRQPKCWVKKPDNWENQVCNSNYLLEQIAVTGDKKHWMAIEPAGERYLAALHSFPLVSTANNSNEWAGRSAKAYFIAWPKGAGTNYSQETTWPKNEQTKRYEALPANNVFILKAAASPNEKFIAHVEARELGKPLQLQVYDAEKNQIRGKFETSVNFDNKLKVDLAITDTGWVMLSAKDELSVIDNAGKKILLSKFNQVDDKNKTTPVPANINCTGLSADNSNLVIGTENGQMMQLKIDPQKPLLDAEYMLPESMPLSNDPVKSCAIANNGTVVGGYQSGRVWVINRASGKSFELSPKVTDRGKEAVISVSIDNQKGYIAALFDNQNSGCSANGLSGQAIKIWGEQQKSGEYPMVSSRCIPNRPILAIGSITSDASLPVAFIDRVESLTCRACSSNDNKAPEQIAKQLSDEAQQKQAGLIDDRTLSKDYGIEF